MLQHIKRLGTETAIYGVSTIIGRFLNFLLVPFYTNVLVPGEYGIVAYVYSLIAFMNVIYVYGMESGYFKYSSTREIGTGKQNFSTPFLSLTVSSLFFSLALIAFSSPIGRVINLPSDRFTVLYYSAGMLFFDTLSVVPFASLRMEGKPKVFAAVKLVNIVINVAANLILLLVFHLGIEGIFLSGLIASATTVTLLVPVIVRNFSPAFSRELYKALLRFGIPYVPAGLASMMIQVVDRPILRGLSDPAQADAVVGIYQANYRLGIFMMLVVSMFDYAWRPFFLNHASDPDAKPLFARILTYFVLLMASVFLLLTLFIPDLVHLRIFGRYIIHPDYWEGLTIVPVVLLGYLFLGIYNNFMAGIYIQKKTAYLPVITFIGAIVNVATNFALIPALGMMGAAVATLLSYVVMAAALFVISQRFYPVQYELGRLAKIAAALGIVSGIYYFVPDSDFALWWKIGLCITFVGLVYVMRFFVPSELSIVVQLFGKKERRAIPPNSDDGK